jgi:DNA repair protein RecO (recombination protein O)
VNQLQTTGITLSRTDYGEADRIITVLTPDYGKLRLMARGVRKVKSKLAGGIELFSVSDFTFIRGKGEIGTLISSRLKVHYGKIVSDITRVQLGYEFLKLINKATEDEPEAGYFHLLNQGLQALNDAAFSNELIRSWFEAQLLVLSGHGPNLKTDITGAALQSDGRYNFDYEAMAFVVHPEGGFAPSHIKALRLLSTHPLTKLVNVRGIEETLEPLAPLIRSLLTAQVRTS